MRGMNMKKKHQCDTCGKPTESICDTISHSDNIRTGYRCRKCLRKILKSAKKKKRIEKDTWLLAMDAPIQYEDTLMLKYHDRDYVPCAETVWKYWADSMLN